MHEQQRRLRSYPHVPHGRRGAVPPHPGGEWELAVFGDLTDKQAEILGRLLDVPPRSKGTIFFDSCGGSAYVGLGLASVIRLRGLKATGIVASECSSAAIVPLAACEERYVTRHSTLLFHPIRWSSDEEVRVEEAAEWARHFKSLEDDLDDLLARMFGMPRDQLDAWTRPGRFVSGEEFAAAGLGKLVDLFAGDVWEQIAAAKRAAGDERTVQ